LIEGPEVRLTNQAIPPYLADAVVTGRVEHGRAVVREAHAVDVIRVGVHDKRWLLGLNVIDVHGVVAATGNDLPTVGRKLDGEQAKVARLGSARKQVDISIN
jgi:hypothetical protein